MGVRTGLLIAAAAGGAVAVAQAGSPGAGPAARTQITIWAAPVPQDDAYGGVAYGGYAPVTGALVTEQRELDVGAGDAREPRDARISGVAATLDPASVQLRDLTDPGAQIADQRFLPAAATPTEILARHVGEPVAVTTPKGDVAGVLRAVDDQVIAVETGAGDQHRLRVMRRDAFVWDIRLLAGAPSDPTLAWRVRTARPGKHAVELSYRADGMAWSADYLAVLDEPGRAVELSAQATIRNATGASYDGVDLTLVGPAPDLPPAGHAPPARYHVPGQVRIGRGDAVQVELVPHRAAVPVRPVVVYEATPDPSGELDAGPASECNPLGPGGTNPGRSDLALELDLPPHTALPEGKVRLLQRRAGKLDVVSEEPLRTAAGIAQIRVAPDADITGERRTAACSADEQRHTLRETIEIALGNHGARAADVVIRESLWRWPVWRIETEDHKGVRAGRQLQEYRVRVPGGGRQAVTYTVVYVW